MCSNLAAIFRQKTMQLINKNTVEIKHNATGKAFSYVSIDIRYNAIYFTELAVKEFNLEKGRYLHFFKTGKLWYYIQNDDATGFRLLGDSNPDGRRGLLIRSRNLVKLISDNLQLTHGVRYSLRKSKSFMNDCAVTEILTNSSFFQQNQKRKAVPGGIPRTAFK